MRRPFLPLLFLLALATPALPKTILKIELRGHALILAKDVPVLKGRLFLFHRYPDGLFMSVAAQEVVHTGEEKPDEETVHFQPGETIVLGPTGEGRSEEVPSERNGAASQRFAPPYMGPGPYGFYGYPGCCFGPRVARSRPSSPAPPALVGPNGFPLMPGVAPHEIGPNGFPILTRPVTPVPQSR